MGKILGIDLGTTNSLGAIYKNGEVVLIPNSFGDYLTPSVVSIDEDNNLYVGKVAKERLISDPSRTVSVFKRSMGTDKKWMIGNKSYSPEELSAMVLKRLKEDAENYLGEKIEEAVISVPAYFGDNARQATREAGRLAGLKVERIVNEPSAAALAGLYLDKKEDAQYLVFDFGGGTLDVSFVDYFENVVQIIAVSGNKNLGGSDFDKAIAMAFCKNKGWSYSMLEPETEQILLRSAEKVKMELSTKEEATMIVSTSESKETMVISRKDLISIIGPGLQRLAAPINNVLRDGKVSTDNLDSVIMVGGSSKMYVVQQYLKYIMPGVELKVSNPDHMIALGLGAYAGIMEREEAIKDVILTDICPFSLGTGVNNKLNDNGNDLLSSIIIPRNTMLPATKSRVYVTSSDGQTKVAVGVYQGEEMYVKDNVKLGEITVDVPANEKGAEGVNVTYTYDINGILYVKVEALSTKETKELTFYQGKVTNDERYIKQAKELSKLAMCSADDEENKLIIEKGKRFFAQLDGSIKEELQFKLNAFMRSIQSENKRDIKHIKEKITELLDMIEEKYIDNPVADGEMGEFVEWIKEKESEADDSWASLLDSGNRPD